MSTNNTQPHEVLAAVVDLIGTVDGTGTWNNDLTGKVFVGLPADPMTTQDIAVYVSPGTLRSERAPRTPLGEFTHTLRFVVIGYVRTASTADANATGGAVAEAWKLWWDISRVLGAKASQSLPTVGNPTGLVHLFAFDDEVQPNLAGPYAEDLGGGLGACAGAVSYQWGQNIS